MTRRIKRNEGVGAFFFFLLSISGLLQNITQNLDIKTQLKQTYLFSYNLDLRITHMA